MTLLANLILGAEYGNDRIDVFTCSGPLSPLRLLFFSPPLIFIGKCEHTMHVLEFL